MFGMFWMVLYIAMHLLFARCKYFLHDAITFCTMQSLYARCSYFLHDAITFCTMSNFVLLFYSCQNLQIIIDFILKCADK